MSSKCQELSEQWHFEILIWKRKKCGMGKVTAVFRNMWNHDFVNAHCHIRTPKHCPSKLPIVWFFPARLHISDNVMNKYTICWVMNMPIVKEMTENNIGIIKYLSHGCLTHMVQQDLQCPFTVSLMTSKLESWSCTITQWGYNLFCLEF